MIKNSINVFLTVLLIIVGCASVKTNVKFYNPVLKDLQVEKYAAAVKKIDKARASDKLSLIHI